ncbi:ribonuclease inhibitor [Microbacterium sp. Gd 4-13]|uniref:ribonuclease inhibitor n=1 Tax=Microbacterium sp. Gd 4-13 TaxID=2173179 RepID=UPI000D563F98|nr:ribonuclease inhibitor [Microbacterium sp. Gd 4-13]PVW06354.1 ribonuclease inhibitor [Microbacterium sp. Gd 4-13]
MATFTIRGAVARSIPSFYDELNRLFMTGEDWKLGPSLDALDDLLYGGYGALQGDDAVRVVWSDHAVSREALGRETTAAYYREKLRHPETYSREHFSELLAQLETGTGQTYFDIILEIFAHHPGIDLVLD